MSVRGGAWLIVIAMLALVGVAVVWPATSAVLVVLENASEAREAAPVPGGLRSVVKSGIGWSLAAAAGAIVVGWAPGVGLARSWCAQRGRVGVLAFAMLVLPVVLPPHIHFWLWWQMWGPDVAWFDWIRRLGWEAPARHVTLWLGLVSWAWPIGAVCIAVALRDVSAAVNEHLRIDGAGVLRRLIFDLRSAWRGILMAMIIVMLFAFNNTTLFDLAQVRTLGYELRAMDSTGASTGMILRAAWPAYAMAIGCIAALGWMVRRGARDELEVAPDRRRGGPGRVGLVFGVLTFFPVAMLLFWRGGELLSSASLDGYETPIINSVAFGFLGGAASVIIALGVGFLAAGAKPVSTVRRARPQVGDLAMLVTLLLTLAASIPATAAALAFIAAFNHGWARGVIYGSPIVVALMLVARFGFVGAAAGLWAASTESPELRALRRLDGAETLRGLWQAGQPRWIAAGVVTLFVVTALSIGEVEAVWRIQPPRYATIAPVLLNNMHYQRDDVVLLAVVVLLIAGGIAAIVAGRTIRVAPRRTSAVSALIAGCAVITLGGCSTDPMESRPIEPVLVFGEPGEILGQFNYPRAIAADPNRSVVYIIDRSGRVQRFGIDGKPQVQWYLPAYDNGFPTGVTVAPDGRVFVADTHEYRVSMFDADGALLGSFGEYGREPGQFTFLCDVAFGPDGRIYVAEFGGNDRIQVFDANGRFLFQFGSFGTGPGEFNRPQSMCFNAEGSELWVADACNHRLQVFDPEGRFLRSVGGVGTGPGEFRYPYGVTAMSDGSLLVCEFGNNRLQVLDASGSPRRILGEGGSGDGQLLAPWGAAEIAGRMFVLDSRNNRVQVIESPQG